jgi:hypothetical protein
MDTKPREYRGFRFVYLGGRSWKIYYPNGHKCQRQFKDTDEVTAAIDMILLAFETECKEATA